VYNPIKVDLPRLESIVELVQAEAGWHPTVWLATTEEDAGQGVTREALDGGAAVVLAAGGDGTVRAVAEALRDTGVPIALIPSGTGNLLARNLSLTLNNVEESIRVAFGDGEHTIDLGIAEIVRDDDREEQHVFLVMAGLGLDAKMIAKTSSKLKKAVGWLAYVDAGVRALPELKPVRLRYSLDGAAERTASVHTIMVGNCGMLPGGILLMPDALPDDGILDIAVLRPSGPFGWLKVWNKVAWENGVLRKSALGRSIIDLTADVKDVLYFRGKDLRLTVETPQEVQLDGDEFGLAKSVHTWADAGGLVVKVPAR
jgi:diacylglycerol kinase family enzyme